MRLHIVTLLLLLTAMNAFSQGENLTPEQQRLAFVKGAWTIDGSETTYLDVCDWIMSLS